MTDQVRHPCSECGKLFILTRPGQEYCGQACRRAPSRRRHRERLEAQAAQSKATMNRWLARAGASTRS